MADEPNVGLARAPEYRFDDDAAEPTKEELQRRMEEARESITQTVTEIKETVASQYQQVRETISDSLDWREQFRRRPVAFSAGALGVGLLVGYGVGGVFGGGRSDDYDDEYSYAPSEFDDDDVRMSVSASRSEAVAPRSYAAQAITGGPYGSTGYESPSRGAQPAYPSPSADVGPEPRPSYSSGYDAGVSEGLDAGEPDASKPGLFARVKESGVIDKFRESKAYDRLQGELSSLGDRVVEELSATARNVVVPALLGKLKDLVGIDLSTQREVAQRSHLEHQATAARANTAAADEATTAVQAGGQSSAASGGSV